MQPLQAARPLSEIEWAAIGLCALAWGLASLLLWRARTRPARHHTRIAVVGLALACLISILVLGHLLSAHRLAIVELANQPWFLGPMIVIAILAYAAKRTFGAAYGALEVVVAILTFWFTIRGHNDSLLVKGLGLSGGVYIFVRGCETVRNSLARRALP
jgi:hypothetical protein